MYMYIYIYICIYIHMYIYTYIHMCIPQFNETYTRCRIECCATVSQREFQDPKMEVLSHIRPYFMGIFYYIALTLRRPYIL